MQIGVLILVGIGPAEKADCSQGSAHRLNWVCDIFIEPGYWFHANRGSDSLSLIPNLTQHYPNPGVRVKEIMASGVLVLFGIGPAQWAERSQGSFHPLEWVCEIISDPEPNPKPNTNFRGWRNHDSCGSDFVWDCTRREGWLLSGVFKWFCEIFIKTQHNPNPNDNPRVGVTDMTIGTMIGVWDWTTRNDSLLSFVI